MGTSDSHGHGDLVHALLVTFVFILLVHLSTDMISSLGLKMVVLVKLTLGSDVVEKKDKDVVVKKDKVDVVFDKKNIDLVEKTMEKTEGPSEDRTTITKVKKSDSSATDRDK